MTKFEEIRSDIYESKCGGGCPNRIQCHEDCVECEEFQEDLIYAVVDEFFEGTEEQRKKILSLANNWSADKNEVVAALWVCSKASMREIGEVVNELFL